MFPSRLKEAARRSAQPQRVCQRCEQIGHAIYECTNPRPYKSRPTRAQALDNPKLAKRTEPVTVDEEWRRTGAADEILRTKDRERRERGWYEDRRGSRQTMRSSRSPSPRHSPAQNIRARSPDSPQRSISRSLSPQSHPESCSTCSPRSHPPSCSTCSPQSPGIIRSPTRSPAHA